MDCRPVPALRDTAITKVALLLYGPQEIKQLLECSQPENHSAEWNQIVNDKVSKLFLPTVIHNELITITKRVYLVLTKFYALHQNFSTALCGQCQCLEGILRRCFLVVYWTSNRFFSEQKFVEDLIRDQRLDVAFRFKIACEFFLRDAVRFLWKQLPPLVKSRLLSADIDERLRTMALVQMMLEDIYELFD
ncbi:hypothetical protein AVEN_63968-1 [Araneus ventricosus]|uniref:Uncharacterized protein n=1 Tax=Araneus ventricosus TaxID=182803 RepID=A0A4Y2KA83_ARAVE|nr:hypothetical protein AVEN_63968-1 [Araneus ventricosus]